jgi:hypothetical protein
MPFLPWRTLGSQATTIGFFGRPPRLAAAQASSAWIAVARSIQAQRGRGWSTTHCAAVAEPDSVGSCLSSGPVLRTDLFTLRQDRTREIETLYDLVVEHQEEGESLSFAIPTEPKNSCGCCSPAGVGESGRLQLRWPQWHPNRRLRGCAEDQDGPSL